jgi:hypothetical protein
VNYRATADIRSRSNAIGRRNESRKSKKAVTKSSDSARTNTDMAHPLAYYDRCLPEHRHISFRAVDIARNRKDEHR